MTLTLSAWIQYPKAHIQSNKTILADFVSTILNLDLVAFRSVQFQVIQQLFRNIHEIKNQILSVHYVKLL